MTRFNTMKLAMAVFIASEAVFFAFLIAGYVYFRANLHGPEFQNAPLDPARTLVFTAFLLASSGTMWLADRRLAADHRPGFRRCLLATILLGTIFIFGQGIEYASLIENSVTPERNLFAASFFTLTGFHGFHVFCGLVSLGVLLYLAFRPNFGQKEISGVAAVSMYWHFVDVVWIFIFSIVYLSVWS